MYMQGHDGDANNCVLVSIANLTGKDYSEIREIAIRTDAYEQNRGTHIGDIGDILERLDIPSTTKKPRRGAERLTGIVAFMSGRKLGHCIAMIQGKVLDTDGVWYNLNEYRKARRYHIRCVHVIADYDIDWSIIPDGLKEHFNIPSIKRPTCNLCMSDSHLTDDCPLASIWKG